MLVCVTIERKKRPINRSRNRLSLTHIAYIFYRHFSSMGPINKFSPIRMKKFFFPLTCLFVRFYWISLFHHLYLYPSAYFDFNKNSNLRFIVENIFAVLLKYKFYVHVKEIQRKSYWQYITLYAYNWNTVYIIDEWNGKDSIKNRNFVFFYKKKDKLFLWSSK